MNGPKMDHFFATKFYSFFSGNPQSNGWSSIFAGSKTLQKVIKITHFDVLQGPFVDGDQASRRVSKIVQNYVKMHIKSPQNEHTKNMTSAFAMVKNARRRLTCENASKRVHFCCSRCCFAHSMDAKIVENYRKFTSK